MAEHDLMLRKLFEDIIEKHGYKDAVIQIEATSSGGANYSSVLYHATISAPNKTKLHLFAKVANLNDTFRAMMPNESYIFEPERFMYMDLAETFKRIEETCDVPEKDRFVFPKFFGYNPKMYEETIILENLAAQGYIVYDRLKSIDWPYASKAVEVLGKFHALSMAYLEQNYANHHQVLKKFTDHMKLGYNAMADGFPKFFASALPMVKEENKERLKKYFDSECSRKSNIFERYFRPLRKSAIVHVDYRPSNIMHKVNKDGTVDLIPVDYQTFREGRGLVDLIYFIFCGSDAEFRAQYYQRLVDHYYDSLSSYLLKLRLDPDKIYPRKDFDYELQMTLPYGLVCAIFLLPVITIEPENAPDFKVEGEMFDKMASLKTSRHFDSRLNGIIDDFVRWGIL